MQSHVLEFKPQDKRNFEALRSKSKSIETRAATPKYASIEVGDTLSFTCDKDSFDRKVVRKYQWKSIEAMVEEIPFKSIMPFIESLDDMKRVYASYPGYAEKLPVFGLVGFELD